MPYFMGYIWGIPAWHRLPARRYVAERVKNRQRDRYAGCGKTCRNRENPVTDRSI
jgi:hypothetical protein